MINRNAIEVLNLDSPANPDPIWTGTVDEFLDTFPHEMTDDEIERLHEQGYVVIDAAPVCVRFALEENCQ